jgi:hypothetical protein
LINGEWIPASDLKVGDELTTIDGKRVRITSIEDIETKEPFPVYNLEAGKYHDFVVDGGDGLGVIVHNSNSPLNSEVIPQKIRYESPLSSAVGEKIVPTAMDIRNPETLKKIVTQRLPDEYLGAKVVVYVDPITGKTSSLIWPGGIGPHHADIAVFMLKKNGKPINNWADLDSSPDLANVFGFELRYKPGSNKIIFDGTGSFTLYGIQKGSKILIKRSSIDKALKHMMTINPNMVPDGADLGKYILDLNVR